MDPYLRNLRGSGSGSRGLILLNWIFLVFEGLVFLIYFLFWTRTRFRILVSMARKKGGGGGGGGLVSPLIRVEPVRRDAVGAEGDLLRPHLDG